MSIFNLKPYSQYTEQDLLLLNTLSFNNQDDYPSLLLKSIVTGNTELAEALIEKQVHLNIPSKQGETPLILTCKLGYYNLFQQICSRGSADLELENESGHTALTLASKMGKENYVEYLISHGANIHHTTHTGANSLIYAANNGHYKCVKLLLKAGININDIDEKNGSTALIYAARYNHKRVIRLLLKEADIDVNIADKDGFTALLYASKNGHKWIVHKLLHNGADKDHKTGNIFQKHNALSLAHKCGHNDVVKIINKNKKEENLSLIKNNNEEEKEKNKEDNIIKSLIKRISIEKLPITNQSDPSPEK
jgi:ankyrin repeat protein